MVKSCTPELSLSRRSLLAGLGAGAAFGPMRLAFASGGNGNRLVVINVKGGLDGLAAVIPYGDPSLPGLRASLLPANAYKVDNFFALDPNLKTLASLFGSNQALAVHAVGPIVDTRSHFEAQDYLQGGASTLLTNGWVNRALAFLNNSGQIQAGLSLSAASPLAIRGATPTAGYAADPYTATSASLEAVIQTCVSNDSAISPVINVAFQDRNVFSSILSGQQLGGSSLVHAAEVAGYCLASPYGPQVACIETESVDTHADQSDDLPPLLADIDAAIAALQTALGSAWNNTVVLTMTEFGRTAYVNGTSGTDHGTAFAMFLAGGAVAGGRVVVNGTTRNPGQPIGWPGLATSQLFQQRDLAPTSDFRQVVLGVLEGHLGISPSNQETIFPGFTATGLPPITGLVTG